MNENGCVLRVGKYCRYRKPVKSRYEPASSTNNPVTTKATQRYYKLHCGNVIDIETKTILNRDTLLKILD